MSSILEDTKKVLGLNPDDTSFDLDVMMHINTVFTTLNELGIGPENGFMIEDDTVTWDTFLGGDPKLNSVKSYMYLRVRQIFDPPQTSFHMQAVKDLIQEMECRLNVQRELVSWVDPTPPTLPDDEDLVLDGGNP